MINLNEQIISFLFSVIYSIIVTIFYKIIKNYTQKCKIMFNLLNMLFYSLICTIVYFKVNLYINSGYINIYFIITFFISIYFTCKILQKKCQNKSNRL